MYRIRLLLEQQLPEESGRKGDWEVEESTVLDSQGRMADALHTFEKIADRWVEL